jgi:GNAT superfamily N-acetyltransferase
MTKIRYEVSPELSNAELNVLYATAWTKHTEWDFQPVLQRSLAWICAYSDTKLVGFVYLAWDGAQHAFLLEPTVHHDFQRRGIGTKLVKRAISLAKEQGLQWVHVDYEPHLESFYQQCGFRPTLAGLVNLYTYSE